MLHNCSNPYISINQKNAMLTSSRECVSGSIPISLFAPEAMEIYNQDAGYK